MPSNHNGQPNSSSFDALQNIGSGKKDHAALTEEAARFGKSQAEPQNNNEKPEKKEKTPDTLDVAGDSRKKVNVEIDKVKDQPKNKNQSKSHNKRSYENLSDQELQKRIDVAKAGWQKYNITDPKKSPDTEEYKKVRDEFVVLAAEKSKRRIERKNAPEKVQAQPNQVENGSTVNQQPDSSTAPTQPIAKIAPVAPIAPVAEKNGIANQPEQSRAANTEKIKDKKSWSPLKKRVVLAAGAAVLALAGFGAAMGINALNNTNANAVEGDTPKIEQNENQGEMHEMWNGTKYRYENHYERSDKETAESFGSSQSANYGNIEEAKKGLLEVCEDQPESFAAIVENFSLVKAEAGLSKDTMSTGIDHIFSFEANGGEVQSKLLTAWTEFLKSPDCEITFYYDDDTEESYYMYQIDRNGDGKIDPSEMELAQSEIQRHGSPKMVVKDKRTGESVDLNMGCDYQPDQKNKYPGVREITPTPPTPDNPSTPGKPDNPDDPSHKEKKVKNVVAEAKNAYEGTSNPVTQNSDITKDRENRQTSKSESSAINNINQDKPSAKTDEQTTNEVEELKKKLLNKENHSQTVKQILDYNRGLYSNGN